MVTLLELKSGGNHFSQIADFVDDPCDYFDFPFSMIAFGESLVNSALCIVDNVAVFRKRNKQMTLVYYKCDGLQLNSMLYELTGLGYKVKSLNFVNKNFESLAIKSYAYEYTVAANWSFELAIQARSAKTRNTMRRQYGKYNDVQIDYPTIGDVMDLFEEWVSFASSRHFMVVKGHYRRYIKRYYEFEDNAVLLGFVDNVGKLIGVTGYEMIGNKAQITLAKHVGGLQGFAYYMWANTLKCAIDDGASLVYCGSTADELKRRLGFASHKSYRINCNV